MVNISDIEAVLKFFNAVSSEWSSGCGIFSVAPVDASGNAKYWMSVHEFDENSNEYAVLKDMQDTLIQNNVKSFIFASSVSLPKNAIFENAPVN